MQRNLRGYVLGSFLIGAMGFAACSSDDEGDDTGVGGSEMGGAGGTKVGTTTVKGGAGPTGGTTATGGVGATTSGPGSTAPVQGGTGPTSSGVPTAGTSSTDAAGAPGIGGATGVGGATATGGAPGGGATATGGTTASGGTTGLAGAAGSAGADPGVAGAAGATSTTPPPPVWPFDAADGWTATTAGWGDVLADTTFETTDGVGILYAPYSATSQLGMISISGLNLDLTGKTLTVRVRHVSGGKAEGDSISFTSGMVFQDESYTPASAVEAHQFTAAPPSEFQEFSYTVPAASAEFDPVYVRTVRFSFRADVWGTTGTVTPATFAIDYITYQ
jgi:hypothetical protein